MYKSQLNSLTENQANLKIDRISANSFFNSLGCRERDAFELEWFFELQSLP
jgi:hypothetical protein